MSTNCCVCMEICAHSGPHTYCDKHKASDYYGTATPRGCPSCAALRARIEDVEKLRVVIKHDAWMITSHDDPFILYQQGNMSKGKLCEYIAKAVCAYLKEGK